MIINCPLGQLWSCLRYPWSSTMGLSSTFEWHAARPLSSHKEQLTALSSVRPSPHPTSPLSFLSQSSSHRDMRQKVSTLLQTMPKAGKTKTRRKQQVKLGPAPTSTSISKTRDRPRASNGYPDRRAKKSDGENAESSICPEIVIRGTIPDVLRWVREQIDEANEFIGRSEHETKGKVASASNARSFAQTMSTRHTVRILLNGSISWKGETRLWENICAFAAKLPGKGNANCIFEAMYRYPSSILVYYGLKPFFGRYVVIAGQKIPRLAVRQSALTVFSPHTNEDTFAKKWFHYRALTRMQETLIHMSAISEYVLRCAYTAKELNHEERSIHERFLSLLGERLKSDRDHLGREVLRFEPWDSLVELSAENIGPCLEKSLYVAHSVVIEGAKESIRLYGEKERNGKERGRIQLWMLRRPLPEVMDALVRRLEVVLRDVLGNGMDIDEFRIKIVKYLRRVETIYEEVGNTWFHEEAEYAIPTHPPKRARFLASMTPYTFSFSRTE